MEKKNIIFLALGLVLTLAITACDEDGDGDDQYYFNNNDTSNGSNNTVQPTDSSSETVDSEIETETEEEIITNPHACDCLRYDDPEKGCYNIEGVWYLQNGTVRTYTFRMVIVLESVGNKCRITNNALREEAGGGDLIFFIKNLWGEEIPLYSLGPGESGQIWEVYLFFLPDDPKLYVKFRDYTEGLPEEKQEDFQESYYSR